MASRPLIDALTSLFRAALFLLPRRLQRRHGEEMADLFARRLRDQSEGGSTGRVLAGAARSFADLATEIVAARFRGRRYREDTASAWKEVGMTTLAADIRLGFRALKKSPLYAAATVATFAFAIGATSAVYSAVKGLLLDPLPFPNADRLVFIGETGLEPTPTAYVTSRYVLDRVAAEVPDLKSVATYNIWEATLTGVGDPKRLSGAVVTAPYFDALGRAPELGRTFRPEDDVDGAPRRVVISHRLWTSRFGGDPNVVGRPVTLSGNDYEIIGVMPADFETPDKYTFTSSLRSPPDVWVTFRSSKAQTEPGSRSYRGVARLAPGASIDRVRSEVEALRTRIGQDFPKWAESSRIRALPLRDEFNASARPTLILLLAGVAFVLVAACVNVMALTLARGLDRASDLRVRAALGAGRGALVRQMVTETVILGVLGGACGVGLAALGVDAFLAAAPPDIPRIANIRLHAGTVASVSALTLVFALVAGLLPSLRLLWGRSSLTGAWRSRGQSHGRGQRRTLAAFSVAQVALAVLLLTGTGLLLRSFAHLVSVDPGYDPTGVVIAQLDLRPASYPTSGDRRRALDEILRRLGDDPAVAHAGFVTSVPQHGLNNFAFGLSIVGVPRDSTQDGPWAHYRGVSPGYAETMGLHVLQGHIPGRQDWSEEANDSLHVAGVAVNDDFVRRFIPSGTQPLGTLLDVGGMMGTKEVPIVGVVKAVKYSSPADEDAPEIYFPVTGAFYTVFLAVKARGDSRLLPGDMKTAVHAVDPQVPMDDVFFQERLLANSTSEARTTLALMAGLALFALVLGAVGVYGVIAHGVARRGREFGIRMALGAAGGAVLTGVLRQGLRLATMGAVIGLALAWYAARLLQGLLYQVGPRDPFTYAGGALLVMAVSLLATWLPARRATRIDPVEALRGE